MINTLKRTTLMVADAARSRSFYAGVLGFTPWYDNTVPVAPGMLPLPGDAGAQTRLIIMRAQDPRIGMIGLLQITAPEPAPRDRPAAPLRVGDVLFVVESGDVAAIAGAVEAHGGRLFAAPYDWSVPAQGTGSPKRLRTTSFFDPDGFFWEASQAL